MNALWISWAVAFAVIVLVVLCAGWAANRRPLGALVDSRGRYSLSRFQLLLWTAVLVSMAAGVFTARLRTRGLSPGAFDVPPAVLGLFGIAAASAVLATAVKAYKNSTRPAWVGASPDGGASLAQLVLVEEGLEADRLVDVAKLQNLLVTVLLAAAYVALGVYEFSGDGPAAVRGAADIRSLPDIAGALLALLAISHATYLGGKLPNRGTTLDERPGYSVLDRVSTVSAPLRQERPAGAVAGDRRAQRRLRRQAFLDELREQALLADATAGDGAATGNAAAAPVAAGGAV